MPVNRCICANVTFTELKKLADAGIRDLDELSRRTGCGTGCGMCIPYIRVMLATGQADLPVLTSKQINQILAPLSSS
ncbi:MAG: (2Fe-2S)-binding protein [Phycisphaeraceae bacterium]|nr:(2Fe-2S)-binding protein [Phycisphaeraceae bacterium]